MLGFSAISTFAISDFPFMAYVPPAPSVQSPNDGYDRAQLKRYREIEKQLEKATQARDRARRAQKESLRLSIAKQVDPEKYAEKPVVEKADKPKREILKAKSLDLLESKVLDLQAQQHQLRYEAWQRAEHARLMALEKRMQQERDDEEALLAIL